MKQITSKKISSKYCKHMDQNYNLLCWNLLYVVENMNIFSFFDKVRTAEAQQK